MEDQFCALHSHRSLGWSKITGDNLDESGFSGAIISHQSNDLTWFEEERHVVERVDCAEVF
jgi:hypothetical protein